MPKLKKLTHRSVPASVGLVKEVRNELRAEIRAVEHRLIAKLDTFQSKLETLHSAAQETLASVHRSQVLMEEQRSENRIVLDGIKMLAERQDRLEKEILNGL